MRTPPLVNSGLLVLEIARTKPGPSCRPRRRWLACCLSTAKHPSYADQLAGWHVQTEGAVADAAAVGAFPLRVHQHLLHVLAVPVPQADGAELALHPNTES